MPDPPQPDKTPFINLVPANDSASGPGADKLAGASSYQGHLVMFASGWGL